jgi:hypothetical protein
LPIFARFSADFAEGFVPAASFKMVENPMEPLTPEQLAAVQRVMSAWEPPASPDHAAAIVAQITAIRRQQESRIMLLRFAAAIILTAAIGLLAGRWSTPQPEAPPQAAAAALHLDDLDDALGPALDELLSATNSDSDSQEVPG